MLEAEEVGELRADRVDDRAHLLPPLLAAAGRRRRACGDAGAERRVVRRHASSAAPAGAAAERRPSSPTSAVERRTRIVGGPNRSRECVNSARGGRASAAECRRASSQLSLPVKERAGRRSRATPVPSAVGSRAGPALASGTSRVPRRRLVEYLRCREGEARRRAGGRARPARKLARRKAAAMAYHPRDPLTEGRREQAGMSLFCRLRRSMADAYARVEEQVRVPSVSMGRQCQAPCARASRRGWSRRRRPLRSQKSSSGCSLSWRRLLLAGARARC